MGKIKGSKRNVSTTAAGPYDRTPIRKHSKNTIFKLNKDIGQHILKNPGIAQAIVDKADLKQSDVSKQSNQSTRLLLAWGRV